MADRIEQDGVMEVSLCEDCGAFRPWWQAVRSGPFGRPRCPVCKSERISRCGRDVGHELEIEARNG